MNWEDGFKELTIGDKIYTDIDDLDFATLSKFIKSLLKQQREICVACLEHCEDECFLCEDDALAVLNAPEPERSKK